MQNTTRQRAALLSRSLLTSGGDFYVVILLVTIVAMMVIPLPIFLIDTLIALNIAFVVTVLIVALYAQNTLALSTFPTILLISTIFRLALTISTTRLILSKADAGAIITTFGKFVVAGNVVVGMVIFLIITVVQFIVITKGAERIAEVSARFQLDALPGKQMSIDGELRNGDITKEVAAHRRSILEQESQFYGAMDGAMKFVKGDAIAGLIIVAVNLLGGLTIGMAQNGLSFGEAGVIYSLLTIGDGLVSQIPALFVAITAGMIVTRVASDASRNVGNDISVQLTGNRPLLAGAGLVVFFAGFVPGFPTLIFLVVAGLLMFPFIRETFFASPDAEDGGSDDEEIPTLETLASTETANVILRMGPSLYQLFSQPDATAKLKLIFDETSRISGLRGGALSIVPDKSLKPKEVRVSFDESDILSADLDQTRLIAGFAQRDAFAGNPDELQPTGRPLLAATWLAAGAASAGPDLDALFNMIAELDMNARIQSFGLDETNYMLEQTAKRYPKLIEATRAVISLADMTNLCKRLVSEGVPLRRIDLILEAVVSFGNTGESISTTADRLRTHIARQISQAYCDENQKIPVITLSKGAEDHVYHSMSSDGKMKSINVDPAFNGPLKVILREKFYPAFKSKHVFMVNTDVRRNLVHILKHHNSAAVVLTFNDVAPGFELEEVDQLVFEPAAQNA